MTIVLSCTAGQLWYTDLHKNCPLKKKEEEASSHAGKYLGISQFSNLIGPKMLTLLPLYVIVTDINL